ncbi:MAG TPA: ABC transporter substrate-binding protein [Xanthobacteraceae bacterium]|jgi:NitT/TauT family transport system substrate-binding protein
MNSLRFLVTLIAAIMGSTVAGAQTVKFGALGIDADGPVYIAVDKGYFREAGIEVTLEHFNSAAQAMAPLSTDQIQVAGGAASAGLFNAFARGWPVRIVFDRTSDRPGFSTDTLSVRSALHDVKTLEDLKGRKVAINAPNAGLEYMVGKMLESTGLTIRDVNVVYMPWPNMGPAFQTGAIDAGALVEPFVTQYAESGVAVPFKRAADVITNPAFEIAVILYNDDWARQHPDQAKAFAIGYLRGARDYHDAMKGGPRRKDVVATLMKYGRLKDPALYDKMQWGYADPNGKFDVDSLREQQEWHASHGSVPKTVDVNAMIDRQYLDYALQKLGRVSE